MLKDVNNRISTCAASLVRMCASTVCVCLADLSLPCYGAQAAAERNMLFCIGLYADPLYFGDYPAEVRERVPHLQRFTPAESVALRASTDFYAMNHYASRCAGAGSDAATALLQLCCPSHCCMHMWPPFDEPHAY